MRIGYNIKRLQDIERARLISRNFEAHEKWSRQELEQYQQQQFQVLIKHAMGASPFYRQLYSDVRVDQPVRVERLPIITKKMMMENFDRFVTDPRLKLYNLQAHLEQLKQDEYYLGEYRVVTTAGTSGLKGVFAYNRQEWSTVLASVLRGISFVGITPRFPDRVRIAAIEASSPRHMTYRAAVSLDVGLFNILRLEATSRIEDLVSELDAFQPEVMQGYPSIIALLAVGQIEGRLNIHPHIISTGSEVRTEGMEEKIRQAWGVNPFNAYGTSEGLFGSSCSDHCGIVLFEDLGIVEVVDEQNQPVQDGSPGYKILFTNLFNYTQPLIRYEVTDLVTISTEPCPCGQPFRHISKIEGRSDDIIYLKGQQGESVPVHPIIFRGTMASIAAVKEYQVVYDERGIHILIVPQAGASHERAASKIQELLKGQLESLGTVVPGIDIQFRERIERESKLMGKLKLVASKGTGSAV